MAEVEEKARRMGWVPKEDFKGDESRWVDADRFVERGENEIPIMRERMKKLDSTIVGLNQRMSGMRDTFSEFQTHQKGVAERAYKKAMDDIIRRQREAAEKGDVEGFDEAEKEKESLVLDVPEMGPGVNVAAEREFNSWVAENDWFNKPKLQKYAGTISVYVQDQTGLTGAALYDEVRKEVELRYPEEFENKNRQSPSKVVGDGDPPVKPGEKSFGKLPKEAQAQCRKFIKEIPGYTKEEYVKDYEWE